MDRFVAIAMSHLMEPRVLFRFEREPYMSKIDDYARVTFDYSIRSAEPDGWTLKPKGDWRYVGHELAMRARTSMVVLELKFESERMPLWMCDLVQSMNLQRRSFSKYGRSIEAWYGGPEYFQWRNAV